MIVSCGSSARLTGPLNSAATRFAEPPVIRSHHLRRVPLCSRRAAAPLRAILEIAFAHLHSRFRTYNNLRSRVRSRRPERQQSLDRRPIALRYRPISFASRGRTAAPPRVSRQSRDARRGVDHHGPQPPHAGGQSSRSPGATGRTDRPRPSRPQNPPPQPAYARLQGPSAHRQVATLLLQETARPDGRRLSWLIRSCNDFSRRCLEPRRALGRPNTIGGGVMTGASHTPPRPRPAFKHCTHSPFGARKACPARTSIPAFVSRRAMCSAVPPCSSSNSGVCGGPCRPRGLIIGAMLSAEPPVLCAPPTRRSISVESPLR